MIAAIDPGTNESAIVLFDGRDVIYSAHLANAALLAMLRSWRPSHVQHVACECIANQGQAVGRSTFETCYLIGRIIEIVTPETPITLVTRGDVKMHLCGRRNKVNDSNISAAIYGLYGGDRKAAMGTKRKPGPLYGLASHQFAALGVALTFCYSPDFRARVEETRVTLEPRRIVSCQPKRL